MSLLSYAQEVTNARVPGGDLADVSAWNAIVALDADLELRRQRGLKTANRARERRAKGTAGICIVCGNRIEGKRLKANRDAERCQACQQQEERARSGP